MYGCRSLQNILAFDRKYLVKLEKLGITLVLYEQYVDDITVSGCSLKPGWSYSRDKDAMVFMAEQVEADSLIPKDQRAMRELCKIADTIDPNLRFEVDCPFLHVEEAVPIFDLMKKFIFTILLKIINMANIF